METHRKSHNHVHGRTALQNGPHGHAKYACKGLADLKQAHLRGCVHTDGVRVDLHKVYARLKRSGEPLIILKPVGDKDGAARHLLLGVGRPSM